MSGVILRGATGGNVMFERYTESARRSLFFARYEASQLGSIAIEPEHLLLGLLREPAAVNALLKIDLGRLRAGVAGQVPFKGKLSTSVEIPFDAQTKRVLQHAAEEANALRHDHIGSEHLLLGLLREERSGAAAALAAQGVRLGDLRQAVAQLSEPLEATAQSIATQTAERLKRMVRALADAPPGSGEAEQLVRMISTDIDALLENHGIS
jgi:ATP-dependent Clp protease ATP-binding subunit ClpC